MAVLQLGTPPAELVWIPIAGFLLSIVATVIGKQQASLKREASLLAREKSGAGPSDLYP
ncbi:hypothetical protein [Rhizobium leguminosarum]|uniref:hypothetical protein n=1 Tax=Rhizobium leguminosarum TaxID=384 RepID=UPI001C940304|nr:hypothetical protein [Rhizobium leguminosarum]